MPTLLICHVLPISLINWTTLFKMVTISYLKTICPLFQLRKTKSKYTADCKAFSNIARLAFKDEGNKFTEIDNGKSKLLAQLLRDSIRQMGATLF